MQIKALQYRFSEEKEIEIYGLGDIHIGSAEFNRKAFEKVVSEILEKENRYCVVLGDVVDNGIEGSKTSPYSQKVGVGNEQIDMAEELLLPLADRILGWTDGNHEQRTSKAVNIDLSALIAERIGCSAVYRPGLCPIMISVGQRKNHHTQPPIYSLGITHGTGGGTTLGAGLTKAEKFALTNGFDALIVGHSHKPSDAPSVRYQADYIHGYMTSKVIRIMVCTGWLDYGGYPITKMYSPVAIMPNKMIFNGEEYRINVFS
jgi:hypothetical protein